MDNPVLWLIIDNSVKLFEIYLIFLFLNSFFIKKFKSSYIYIVLIAVFFISITVINSFKVPAEINLLFSCVFTILITTIFYKGKLLKKILMLIFFYCIFAFTEAIIIFIITSAFGVNFNFLREQNGYKIFGMFLTKIGIFLVIKFITQFMKKTNAQKIPLKYWILLMVVPIVTSVAMFSGISLISSIDVNRINPYLLSASFSGLLFTNIIVFYLFESILANEEIKYSYKAVQSQMELQEKHYNEIEENQEETRRIWHDMKHHINYIGLMLKDNNINGAKD